MHDSRSPTVSKRSSRVVDEDEDEIAIRSSADKVIPLDENISPKIRRRTSSLLENSKDEKSQVKEAPPLESDDESIVVRPKTAPKRTTLMDEDDEPIIVRKPSGSSSRTASKKSLVPTTFDEEDEDVRPTVKMTKSKSKVSARERDQAEDLNMYQDDEEQVEGSGDEELPDHVVQKPKKHSKY